MLLYKYGCYCNQQVYLQIIHPVHSGAYALENIFGYQTTAEGPNSVSCSSAQEIRHLLRFFYQQAKLITGCVDIVFFSPSAVQDAPSSLLWLLLHSPAPVFILDEAKIGNYWIFLVMSWAPESTYVLREPHAYPQHSFLSQGWQSPFCWSGTWEQTFGQNAQGPARILRQSQDTLHWTCYNLGVISIVMVILRVSTKVQPGSQVWVWADKSMKQPGPCVMYFGKTLPVTAQVIMLNNVLPSITILISATTYPNTESSIVSQVDFMKCSIFYILCDGIGSFSIIFCCSFLDCKPQPKLSHAGKSNINWRSIRKKQLYLIGFLNQKWGKINHQNNTFSRGSIPM